MKRIMTHREIISSIILLLLPCLLSAQSRNAPGFLINAENDTLRGFIRDIGELKRFRQVEFGLTEKEEKTTYYPGEIRAYGTADGKFYVSMLADDSANIFLEYLVDGIADLYYYRDIEGPHYLIFKGNQFVEMNNFEDQLVENGKETKLQLDQRTGMLNYFFADCPEIQPQLEQISLSHASLIRITKDYHDYECRDGEACIVYEKQLSAIRLSVAPVVGGYYSSYHDEDPYTDRFLFKKDFYPVGGFSLKLNLQRFSEKFNLILEGTGGKFHTAASAQFIYGFRTETHDIDISYSYFKLALPLSYSMQTGKLRPEFMLGLSMAWTFNPEVNRTIAVEGGSGYEPVHPMPEVNKRYGGAFARTGAAYHFNNKDVLFFHFGYEYAAGMTNTYAVNMNSWLIMAGYYF